LPKGKAVAAMRTKRSRRIHLVLLASTSVAMSACDKPPAEQAAQEQVKGETVKEELTFVEPGKCADVGLAPDGTGVRTYSAEYCERTERYAREEFARTAPVYGSREQCVAEHGEESCAVEPKVVERDGETQTGWTPAFAGFMVGTAAALAAAHIFHTMAGNANGRISRPVPVYTSVSEPCRRNPQDPKCRSGGAAGAGGRAGYVYGYNGYTVAEPSTSGRATATVTRTASGSFAPATAARAGFGGGAARGFAATARGGFGASAGAHGGGGT
jgi:uncharacterized protein YgiB involved in biofilm formation